MDNSREGMNWKAGITSYQLKWIAIVTMVIDHTGAILYPTEMAFRYIGRISDILFSAGRRVLSYPRYLRVYGEAGRFCAYIGDSL